MAKFSLREAFKFSFLAYLRHFVPLASIGIMLAGWQWVSTSTISYIVDRLGIYKTLGIADVLQQSNIGSSEAKTILSKILTNSTTVPLGDYVLLFSVWLLTDVLLSFLWLGLMRLVLSIKDNDSGSLTAALSFISIPQTIRFMATYLLVYLAWGILFLAGGLAFSLQGSGALGSLLLILLFYAFSALFNCWPSLDRTIKAVVIALCLQRILTNVPFVIFLLGTIIFCIFYWLCQSIFAHYCIADDPDTGVLDASFRISRDLSRGSIMRIFGGSMLLHLPFAGMVCALENVSSLFMRGMLTYGLSEIIFSPLYMLYLGYIYRTLSLKRSS